MTLTIATALLILTAAAHAARGPNLPTLISEQIVATWSCQDKLRQPRTQPSKSPWALGHHSVAYKKWLLKTWVARKNACIAVLHEQARQWNWQAFLTPVEKAVLLCETNMNWQHNSGTYQGAPGFYHGSWDAFKPAGYPAEAYQATPWQQTVVMRRIRDRYGWSGWGCYTHGGYRYHL